MKQIQEFKVYLYKDGQCVDETCIDERDEQLAWELFKEFGHKIKIGEDWQIEIKGA